MVNPIKSSWLTHSLRCNNTALQHYLCGVLRSHLRDYFPYFSFISIIHWLLFLVLPSVSGVCGLSNPLNLTPCSQYVYMLFLVQIETLKLSRYKCNLVQNLYLFYLSSPLLCRELIFSFWQNCWII